jgi:glycine betaine/choline ABC-type transport system substrate-binding protein
MTDPDFPDYSRSRAILIGTSIYQDESFPPLQAVANSLHGLQEVLIDSQLCRWPDDRVTVLENFSDARVLVKKLRRWASETEDVLIVYFAGRGIIDRRGALCLAVSDTDTDDPDVTGIEYDLVRRAIEDSPARIKVVVLDWCYPGGASQAVPADIANITDVPGVYTVMASDHAAHVSALSRQAGGCTSFTGELLDLISKGVTGEPETLTLNMVYSHLRTRLHSARLPAPSQGGPDGAGDFVLTRNAALLTEPLARFPRRENPPPVMGRSRRMLVAAATAALVVAAGVTYLALRPGAPSARGATSCPAAATSSTVGPTGVPSRKMVVIGSDNFPEDKVIADIYADALRAKGYHVTRNYYQSLEGSYPLVCRGIVTVIPEYNGELLTASVNSASKAFTTSAVDAAVRAGLPSSLVILNPAPGQNKDTLTVTQAMAAKYRLGSIADLHRVPHLLIGGPQEFQFREQGLIGLNNKYRLRARFRIEDESGPLTLHALEKGRVDAADIFTTSPYAKMSNLVALTDPLHLFIVENVVPLVYKRGLSTEMRRTLNAISAKLTTEALEELNTEITIRNESRPAAAAAWLRQVGLPESAP